MFLPELSIKKPIFCTMMIATIVVFGVLGYQRLGVDEYPKVDYPYVTVTTTLRGASPEVMDADVTDPIEEEINTIQGIRNLTSASSEGVSVVTVEFELDRDIDAAAQDVRDKVSVARGKLPKDIDPPVVDKEDPQAQPIMWLAVSGNRPLREISDYAHYDLKPKFEVLTGVGSIREGGIRQRAIRIWLEVNKLEAFQVTVSDVIEALQKKHIEVPSGRIESSAIEFSVKTEGEFSTAEAFNDLIIVYREGAPVKLSDVGYAEDGMEDKRLVARYRETPGVIEPAVGLGIKRQSDANTVAVADGVKKVFADIRKRLRAGIRLDIAMDVSRFIIESIKEVQFAIILGSILASVVVLFFLRNLRSTFIIALAIPTSFLGTFAAMYFLGFTLNNMTLLALSLAVGEVVDDAIIVLENSFRHLEEGEDRLTASRSGISEIVFAVITSTVALVAVFVPIAFMKGIVGRFFLEFGLTISIALIFSMFVALTLTPMLCSRWLRLPKKERKVFKLSESMFLRTESIYRRTLEIALRHRFLVVVIAVASFAVAMVTWRSLGKELVPSEDQSQFMVVIKTPVGSSIDYTDSILHKCEGVMDGLPEIRSFFAASGFGGVNKGVMFVHMTPKNERTRTQQEVMNYLRGRFAQIPGALIFPLDLTRTFGARRGAPLEFSIAGPDLNTLARLTETFIRRLSSIPGIIDVDTDLELGRPEVRACIDRNKAADLGIDVATIGNTIRALVGGLDVVKFKSEGKRYDVIVRLVREERDVPFDISRLLTRNLDGNIISLSDMVDIKETVGLNTINRRNRQRSATISANLEPTKPLGTALMDINKLVEEILPQDYTLSLSGKAETFRESYTSLLFALFLSIIISYIVLASLFESFLHPFTVMLAVPLSIFGAFGILWLTGNTINVFSMIGVILLMGLVTKNSILLVDYTNTLRKRGLERNDAVLTASPIRLRPILMTAISTILGVLPVALGIGPGAESRAPMAIATAGGMFASMMLTLIVVPVFYTLFDDFVNKVFRRARKKTPVVREKNREEVYAK
ncbi:MAG TPA: efflux RND transporter permease subunit [Candidatus Brocadiia bacterium]|nr:efflux RND transporter permease subunit [Candidatus Brocadiales bacterium]